jgi:hypothetical protein
MKTPQELRRMAWYFLPFIFIVAADLAWSFIDDVQLITRSFREDAPVLYIQSGVVIFPLVSITMLTMLALAIARMIPLEALATKIERWLLRLLFTCIILIPIVMIVGSLIQHHYLPKLGYSKCNILFNGRSMLANTWIKPADLCVYNKTTSWVREEAAKRASGAASQANPEVNTSK